ncbi:uncharacterized protein [Lepisosteus oculatus]|uniref:uncharacterized protein isoform X2 n=1 Tax=Lepisosteus oculatus TaxID=7918 RepID=UPI00073FEF52|nr:PREDICTED: uncharacterized protein LOC107076381 [Lepisosteus oculatus]
MRLWSAMGSLVLLLGLQFVVQAVPAQDRVWVFSQPGQDATVPCTCSREQSCFDELLRWVRMDPNGKLEILNTDCKLNQNTGCRYSSTRIDSNRVQLTVHAARPADSGVFYCGEHLSSYMAFTDRGTVLVVGDPPADSPSVSVLVRPGRRGEGLALLCLVSGLALPWAQVSWLGAERERPALEETTRVAGRYRVTSRLNVSEEEWSEGGPWSCQARTGWASVHQSPNVSSRTLEGKDSRQTNGGALVPGLETDTYGGVTYAHLDLKPAGRPGRRRQDRQEDRLTYSEVRYARPGGTGQTA